MRALGQRVEFDNATRALIREIEGSIPPDDGGGGGGLVPPSKSEGSEGGNKRPKDSPEGFKEDGGEGGGWDIKEIAKRQEAESDLKMEQRIKAMIDAYLPLLKLDEKQNRYILGHKGYIEGRSYYTEPINVDKVKELVKTGMVKFTRKNEWDEKIIIDYPGILMPHEKTSIKKPIPTSKSKVHFSNDSFHIVPYRDDI
ncbi:polymorphic toxin type 50 domain-containing protein [Helicobacter baculiformis]|uniref:Polymorphic toxin type 50 domain-containing protein n=1 Tax=Helicobacter baculiformis TaxID=427351 RepID=A0ABV7ZIP0_9HELI|nr:polymorphic toxin type 50 domain-containing protein [Helicobacter baculiformis]